MRIPYIGSPALALAAILYLALSFFTVRAVGIVGEVGIGWALASPPTVVVSLAADEALDRVGPLEARPARPTESLVIGGWRLPLAVNAYTGGPADWPARAARAVTGDLRMGVVTHVGLGLLLLALAHRFLRFHGTATAAGAVALLLATDWCFVFYRKVLGGTEILLQAAGLLVLWSLWSRRWKGGVHGTSAIAVGVGLGLLAKATFVATLLAFAIAAMSTRWDRSAMKPPAGPHPAVFALPVLLLLPLIVAGMHHASLPLTIVSHDTLTMQIGRLGQSGGRETVANLVAFLGHPLSAFAAAWGCAPVEGFSPLRTLGLVVPLAGAAIEWRARTPSASAALLRYLSLAVPLQIGLLFVLNRDLHHLAQAAVPLALFTALGADRVAAAFTPARSVARALGTAALIAPTCLAGSFELLDTDAIVRSARSQSFTEPGQQALIDMLRRHDVRRLVTTSYETYGMIDARAPDIEVVHAWGAMSRRERDLPALLDLARGGHYLSMRGSAPFIYDWRPNEVPGRVDALGDSDGNWAELFWVQ